MAKCGIDSAQVRAGLKSLGYALYEQSKFSGFLAQLRLALEEEPNRISSLNLAASLLATCADSSLRNGTEAIELADKASRLTDGGCGRPRHSVRCHAEDGNVAQALEIEQRAVALAAQRGEDALETGLEIHLAQYASCEPIQVAHARGRL